MQLIHLYSCHKSRKSQQALRSVRDATIQDKGTGKQCTELISNYMNTSHVKFCHNCKENTPQSVFCVFKENIPKAE